MGERSVLRSTIFNICFYTYMIVGSFGLFWMFFIPRTWAIGVVRWYFSGVTYLERWILGLSYRVNGAENLPADGRYILAMKHQSAYETIKLVPVFGDVAIALKRELTWIPLWGWYTIKTGMIPIDRGARGKAMESLIAGGRKAMAAGRPIMIYPQGTRVPVGAGTDKYPYKMGVVRLAQALDVPIVPVAINSGVFWAKRAFLKSAGRVDFDILPPVFVQDRKAAEVLSDLQTALEARSNALAEDPQITAKRPGKRRGKGGWIALFSLLVILAAAWCGWWQWSAQNLRAHIESFAQENVQIVSRHAPQISGFPFKMKVNWPDVRMVFDAGILHIGYLQGEGWPYFGAPVQVRGMGQVRLSTQAVDDVPQMQITLQSVQADFTPTKDGIDLQQVELVRLDSRIVGVGNLFIPVGDTDKPYDGQLDLTLYGAESVVAVLQENSIIDRRTALLLRSVVHSLSQASTNEPFLNIPLRVMDGTLYAHIIPIARLQRAPAP